MTITIGLDFDGLIGDLRSYQKGGAQYAAWKHAIGLYSPECIRKPMWDDAIVQRALEEAHTDPESPLYLKPVPGAIEEISALHDEGFILHVVTARGEGATNLAAFWLLREGLALPFHATRKDRTKRHALGRIGALAHVDDTQSVLHDLRDSITYRFLFAHGPYEHPIAPDLHFATSWHELGQALRRLESRLLS